MYLNDMYNKVPIGKHLCVHFPIRNDLNEDVLSQLLFNIALKYATKKVQEDQVGLKLYGTRQLLAHADDANLLDRASSMNGIYMLWGHTVASWLRHYATSQKVAGSRPDEVNFNLPTP
jgi:hypothetical protein